MVMLLVLCVPVPEIEPRTRKNICRLRCLPTHCLREYQRLRIECRQVALLLRDTSRLNSPRFSYLLFTLVLGDCVLPTVGTRLTKPNCLSCHGSCTLLVPAAPDQRIIFGEGESRSDEKLPEIILRSHSPPFDSGPFARFARAQARYALFDAGAQTCTSSTSSTSSCRPSRHKASTGSFSIAIYSSAISTRPAWPSQGVLSNTRPHAQPRYDPLHPQPTIHSPNPNHPSCDW
jgi:hypothetical protein